MNRRHRKDRKGQAARYRRALAVSAVCWTLAAGAGCASGGGPRTSRVAESIEAGMPGCDLERESHLSLGSVSLSAVRAMARLAGEPEDFRILEKIRRLETATYRFSASSKCHEVVHLGHVEDDLGRDGWWLIARERDGVESSWVFARGDREGDLDGLFVVTLTGGELEVVRLEGQIAEIVAEAVSEDPSEAARIAGSG